MIAKVFDMCAKGTTRAAIDKVAKDAKVGAPRLFHCMRRGAYGDVTWTYTQKDDKVKLVPGKAAKSRKPAATAKSAKSVKSAKPVTQAAA